MISFTLNGQAVSVDMPVDTPLLWVIRDYFKLKGSKFGCGMGLCGACSVLLNGQSTRSCILPLAVAANQTLVTIEGLGSPEKPSQLQQAWVEHNVPQCGYCQSGQLISATALLAQIPEPNDEQIDQGMQGNICRCGTYPRIKQAIKSVSHSSEINASEIVQTYSPNSEGVL